MRCFELGVLLFSPLSPDRPKELVVRKGFNAIDFPGRVEAILRLILAITRFVLHGLQISFLGRGIFLDLILLSHHLLDFLVFDLGVLIKVLGRRLSQGRFLNQLRLKLLLLVLIHI